MVVGGNRFGGDGRLEFLYGGGDASVVCGGGDEVKVARLFLVDCSWLKAGPKLMWWWIRLCGGESAV